MSPYALLTLYDPEEVIAHYDSAAPSDARLSAIFMSFRSSWPFTITQTQVTHSIDYGWGLRTHPKSKFWAMLNHFFKELQEGEIIDAIINTNIPPVAKGRLRLERLAYRIFGGPRC